MSYVTGMLGHEQTSTIQAPLATVFACGGQARGAHTASTSNLTGGKKQV